MAITTGGTDGAIQVPELKLCDSSMIHSYGYDAVSIRLFVRFKHERKLYLYEGVTPGLYQRMCDAESVGGFFKREIQPKYSGELLKEGD